MIKHDDHLYMRRCFELAQKGLGKVSPNPMVGAVIVKNDRIIGEGFHEYFGGPHAEVNALKNCSESPVGATLYVNLEPCCHIHKKTPPCLPLVLNAGFSRVVISNIDPNKSVAGKSVEQLKSSSLDVEINCLREEGEKINKVFFHHQKTSRPFVHLKYAQSLNGYIQALPGKYLSNEQVLKYVHQLRAKYDSILIGRKTLEIDNPSLTVRYGIECDQSRKTQIIVGNVDRITGMEKIFSNNSRKLIITTNATSKKSFANTDVVQVDEINPASILSVLHSRGISSVLIEGGSSLIKMFLESDFVDDYSINVAPTFLNEGVRFQNPSQPMILSPAIKTFGDQVVFERGH